MQNRNKKLEVPEGNQAPAGELLDRLVTVEQLAQRGPLSLSGWRWALFNRRDNGLNSAVVKVGRRIYLDLGCVESWLAAQREVA